MDLALALTSGRSLQTARSTGYTPDCNPGMDH